MEALATVLVLIVILMVVWKLGLFAPVVNLSEVAERESAAYNREHKARVAKRYESLSSDFDTKKVNDAIKKIDSLHFD